MPSRNESSNTQAAPGMIAQASTSMSTCSPSTYCLACTLRMPAMRVAQLGRVLEFQARARGVHRLGQVVHQFAAAPFEEQRGAAHACVVVAGRDQADAGRAATADLVLQAGPAAVPEDTVLAGAQLEHLLHQIHRLAHRARARIRAEVTPGVARGPRWKAIRGQVSSVSRMWG